MCIPSLSLSLSQRERECYYAIFRYTAVKCRGLPVSRRGLFEVRREKHVPTWPEELKQRWLGQL